MQEPYDADTIKRIATEYEQEAAFTARNTVMRDRRELRNRRKRVNHPRISESLAVYSPRINQDIGLFSRRLDAASLTLSVSAKEMDDDSIKAANSCKQYWMRSYVQINRRKLVPPSLKVLDRQAGDGVGWYRIRLDPQLIDRLSIKNDKIVGFSGEKGLSDVPFILETPDPLAMYYEPDLSRIAEVGYVTVLGDTPVGDTTGQMEAQGRRTKVWKIVRVETTEYVYDLLYVTDKARNQEERFVVQPQIFRAPAYVPVPGLVGGSEAPIEAWQPLIVNLYPHVEHKNLLQTMLNNAADITGAPMFWLKRGADPKNPANWRIGAGSPSAEREEVKIDTASGKVEIPEGYEPVPLSLAAGIDLMRAIEQCNLEMIDAGFPPILAAPQEITARSGYDRAVMERAIGFYIEPPLSNHARAWYDLFVRQAEAIKTLGAKVTVRTIHQKGERQMFAPTPSIPSEGEVTVGPETFEDVDMEVGFSAETAASRIALEEEGMRMMERGLLSRTEFFEDYRGVDDVDRTVKLIDRDERQQIVKEAGFAYLKAILAEQFGEMVAGSGSGRPPRRRPPAGAGTPGVGATLNQEGVTTPGPVQGEPALGEMAGQVA